MKIVEFDEECSSCKGTGLYVGRAERYGAAVVCNGCKGTGRHHFKHEYNEFEHRKERKGVCRVFECNPGICISSSSRFGGMPVKEWLKGQPFPAGSENREYTCPSWWYQSADYDKKPEWDKCFDMLGGSFSHCKHFPNKDECWQQWDKENKI